MPASTSVNRKAELPSCARAGRALSRASGLTVAAIADTASEPARNPRREKRALISSPIVGFALWLRGSASAASSCEVLKMGVWAVIAVLLNSMSGADGADLLAPPDSPTTVA